MKTAMEGTRVGKRRTVVVFAVALVVVVAAVFGYLLYGSSPATGTSTAVCRDGSHSGGFL